MTAAARIAATERARTRIRWPTDRCSRSETIDRPELELPARIRAARRLAEIGVADDADVPVRGVVLVVEQIEHVGTDFHAVLARQHERARQREVDGSDGSASRGIASFRSRQDRKSTRLNSSHSQISYAVF